MSDVNKVWLQILADLNNHTEDEVKEPSPASSDELMIDQTKKENSGFGTQYDKRDKIYTDLLDKYKSQFESKSNWNKIYKLIFYIVAMVAFIGIIAVSMYIIYIVAAKGDGSISDVAVVVGSTSGIISAIIVLPKIIAEHLFPTDEHSHMINMVQNMQVNDSRIRSSKKKYKANNQNRDNKTS